MTDLAPYTPPTTVTTEPVKFLDMTGVSEDVLWAIGRASRMGQLVRIESHTESPDGTIRARIAYTGETPQMPTALALPAGSTAPPVIDERWHWDSWDYFMAAIRVGQVAIAGTAVWLIYEAVLWVRDLLATYGAQILGGIAAIVAVILLLALLGGGKGCAGIHCGGCKG